MDWGKIRAWTDPRADDAGVLAAYVGVPGDSQVPLQRAPATRLCASAAEARQWIESEAQALGLPVEWDRSQDR
jgi:hypothetical protein